MSSACPSLGGKQHNLRQVPLCKAQDVQQRKGAAENQGFCHTAGWKVLHSDDCHCRPERKVKTWLLSGTRRSEFHVLQEESAQGSGGFTTPGGIWRVHTWHLGTCFSVDPEVLGQRLG